MFGIATIALDTLRYADIFGPRAFQVALKKAVSKTAQIDVPGVGAIAMRSQGCDWDVFDQVFLEKCYRPPADFTPRFIVDAGAHIGLATVSFAARYPNASVVSIEPNEENFKLLVSNTRQFPNVKPLRGALWAKESQQIRIKDSEAASWAMRVEEGSGNLQGYTVAQLLRESGFPRIDLLKIDIEGTEYDILHDDSCQQWLEAVDMLMIELHDHITPGCSMELCRRLGGRAFQQKVVSDLLQIDFRQKKNG